MVNVINCRFGVWKFETQSYYQLISRKALLIFLLELFLKIAKLAVFNIAI